MTTHNQLSPTETHLTDDKGSISDGSHTFDELYYHRMMLFSVICETFTERSWKSRKHHPKNSDMYEGYFIVGVDTPEGQYAYHYQNQFWDYFNVVELECAPVWDNHTPDCVTRLRSLLNVSEFSGEPWSGEKISEAEPYGIHLYNTVSGIPMIHDRCEVCKQEFHREVFPSMFPRYCPQCLTENPKMRDNELKAVSNK